MDLVTSLSPGGAGGRLFKKCGRYQISQSPGGCGGIRQDARAGKLLASYASHPNVGGVTGLSLGCPEPSGAGFINDLKKKTQSRISINRLYIFEQQQSQSEEQLIASP